jgi:hypothetical protein
MGVNSAFKEILKNRTAVFLLILGVISAVFFIASSFTKVSNRTLFTKQVNLTIREVGHHLLLQGGDSTSRLLPVKEIEEGVFMLEFEDQLVFQPDSLIALSRRFLANTGLSDYTVTVHECLKTDILYGFQISATSNNLTPCNGRTQPRGCYTIEIAFTNFDSSTPDFTSPAPILSAFLVLISIVLLMERTRKPRPLNDPATQSSEEEGKYVLPSIGRFTFDLRNQKLYFDNQHIVLTEKECKILELLNRNFNQLTPREDLIQEVWANEGVITGRSLDVFVSKLRKKLSADPDLRVTNIHGKGYKLELVKD